MTTITQHLRSKRVYLASIGVFAVALTVYWASAVLLGRVHSHEFAYFNYLAEAFLHGRLFLINPPSMHDLTLYEGRWYVPFPPLPALLMLPWCAIRGAAGTNTVLFSVVIGATNVTLMFLLLHTLTERGWSHLRLGDNLWLTMLFGIGSVHWYMSTVGSVWYVGQICAVTFVVLSALLAANKVSPVAVGWALAMAMCARLNVILCYPLLVGIAFQSLATREDGIFSKGSIARWCLLSIIPVAAAGGALLIYNWLRFDNPLNFGYLTENVAGQLTNDLWTYGQFDVHYIRRNLRAMLFALPVWDSAKGWLLPDGNGMSLLLTTPGVIYLYRARQRMPLVVAAWIAIVLSLLPLLTYYNTGWYQFGYRFSLDFMTPILVLLSIAVGKRLSPAMRVLIVIGVLVNAGGVAWFENPSL